MKVKKFYTLQIECHTQEEYNKVKNYIKSEVDPRESIIWDFEDKIIQVEYLSKKTFEKISKLLKTL